MNNNGNKNNGVGFLDLLTIVFIVLKLTGVIDWKWVWVLAPFWGQFVFLAVLALAVLICEKKRKKDKGQCEEDENV